MLKVAIFECKGNLYYQIGNRDFRLIKLPGAGERVDEAKPTPREKADLTKLLPIRLNSLHVNLSYCASNMWSAMIRPMIEFFSGMIEYYYRRYVQCDDTSIIVNDAITRQGFILAIGVSIKVLTILNVVAKMLFINLKAKRAKKL